MIADEVQTGFARVGTHFWAFEVQGEQFIRVGSFREVAICNWKMLKCVYIYVYPIRCLS